MGMAKAIPTIESLTARLSRSSTVVRPMQCSIHATVKTGWQLLSQRVHIEGRISNSQVPHGVPQELITVTILVVAAPQPTLAVRRNTLPITEAKVIKVPVVTFVRSLVAMLSHAVSCVVILT